MLFPAQDLVRGQMAMGRLRQSIADLEIGHIGNAPHGVLTISSGLTVVDGGTALDAHAILNQADEALYRAKDLGRNRVACYGVIDRIPALGVTEVALTA